MMFQVGDDVYVKNHPNKPAGVITKVHVSTLLGGEDEYEVTFIDTSLIPPIMRYKESSLAMAQLDLPFGISNTMNWVPDEEKEKPKCECGRDTYGQGKHSDWCPLEYLNDRY